MLIALPTILAALAGRDPREKISRNGGEMGHFGHINPRFRFAGAVVPANRRMLEALQCPQ
jgi:hypothetical protein